MIILDVLLLIGFFLLPIVTVFIFVGVVRENKTRDVKRSIKKGLFRATIVESILIFIFILINVEEQRFFAAEGLAEFMGVVFLLVWAAWLAYWALGFIKKGFFAKDDEDGNDKWWPPRG